MRKKITILACVAGALALTWAVTGLYRVWTRPESAFVTYDGRTPSRRANSSRVIFFRAIILMIFSTNTRVCQDVSPITANSMSHIISLFSESLNRQNGATYLSVIAAGRIIETALTRRGALPITRWICSALTFN